MTNPTSGLPDRQQLPAVGSGTVRALVLIAAVAVPAACLSAECRVAGGHMNGDRITGARSTHLDRSGVRMTGWHQVAGGPKLRVAVRLPCVPLYSGVMCEGEIGPNHISIMTNGPQMVEKVTNSRSGQEILGAAWQCDWLLKF